MLNTLDFTVLYVNYIHKAGGEIWKEKQKGCTDIQLKY